MEKTYVWLGLAVLAWFAWKKVQANQAIIASDPFGLAAAKPPGVSQADWFAALSGL